MRATRRTVLTSALAGLATGVPALAQARDLRIVVPFGPGSGSASGGKVKALRLNGSRAEIRRESVRSVLALLLQELVGEHTGNERAQDTERNGGF